MNAGTSGLVGIEDSLRCIRRRRRGQEYGRSFGNVASEATGDDVDAGAVGDKALELRGVERDGAAVVRVGQRVAGVFQQGDEVREIVTALGVDVGRHLHHKNGTETTKRFRGAPEDREFVAVDVDLDQVECPERVPVVSAGTSRGALSPCIDLSHSASALQAFSGRCYQGSPADVSACRLGIGGWAPVRHLNEATFVGDYVLQMPPLLGARITE